MHARIRPAGALGHGSRWIEGPEGFPELTLAAAQGGLDLPAVESGSRIGHGQKVGMGHHSILVLDRVERSGAFGNARSTVICAIHWTYIQAFQAHPLFHGLPDPPTAPISGFLLNKFLDHTASAA